MTKCMLFGACQDLTCFCNDLGMMNICQVFLLCVFCNKLVRFLQNLLGIMDIGMVFHLCAFYDDTADRVWKIIVFGSICIDNVFLLSEFSNVLSNLLLMTNFFSSVYNEKVCLQMVFQTNLVSEGKFSIT